VKENPVSGLVEPWRLVDFTSLNPSAFHFLTFLFDNVGIPASYRQMEGFAISAFVWVNSNGAATLVKYHWVPLLGVATLTDEEVQTLPFYLHHQDLYENIANGNFPQYSLRVQMLPFEKDDPRLDFNILDATKQWPLDIVPEVEIGILTLNQNPLNQFIDNEMTAFNPANLVPGILTSDDHLLQGRLFIYGDTHRYRLGVNHKMLFPNRPIESRVFNDAFSNGFGNEGTPSQYNNPVNYYPSNVNTDVVQSTRKESKNPEVIQGRRVRKEVKPIDDFSQAGDRYRTEISSDPDRKTAFITRLASLITSPNVNPNSKALWLQYWALVDPGLGTDLASLVSQLSIAMESYQKGDATDAQIELLSKRALVHKNLGAAYHPPVRK